MNVHWLAVERENEWQMKMNKFDLWYKRMQIKNKTQNLNQQMSDRKWNKTTFSLSNRSALSFIQFLKLQCYDSNIFRHLPPINLMPVGHDILMSSIPAWRIARLCRLPPTPRQASSVDWCLNPENDFPLTTSRIAHNNIINKLIFIIKFISVCSLKLYQRRRRNWGQGGWIDDVDFFEWKFRAGWDGGKTFTFRKENINGKLLKSVCFFIFFFSSKFFPFSAEQKHSKWRRRGREKGRNSVWESSRGREKSLLSASASLFSVCYVAVWLNYA